MSTKKTLTLFIPLMSSSLRRNARGQSLSAVPNHRCRRWMNTHELFLPSLFAAHTRRLQPLQQLLQLLIVKVLPALHCDRLQVLAKFHCERHGVSRTPPSALMRRGDNLGAPWPCRSNPCRSNT